MPITITASQFVDRVSSGPAVVTAVVASATSAVSVPLVEATGSGVGLGNTALGLAPLGA
jgi:hypothetical protein